VNHAVLAELVASVFKVVVKPGDDVRPGDTIVILESMKMEIPVLAEVAGTVSEVAVAEGDVITEGDTIALITSA
jgi:acetyl-CoA carboxylase biotin carboxyl carrier protein